eukprot:Hpha_TRINITY_DN3911_c0_g1::TRINITY_DN3911_c0_g1_i1::g.18152::m.18152
MAGRGDRRRSETPPHAAKRARVTAGVGDLLCRPADPETVLGKVVAEEAYLWILEGGITVRKTGAWKDWCWLHHIRPPSGVMPHPRFRPPSPVFVQPKVAPPPPPEPEKVEEEESSVDDESYSGDTEEREAKRRKKKEAKKKAAKPRDFRGKGDKLTVEDWKEAFKKAAVEEMRREVEKEDTKHIFELLAEQLELEKDAYEQRFNAWAERGEITAEILQETAKAAKEAAEEAKKDLLKMKEIEKVKNTMMEVRLADLTLTTGDIRRAMVKAVERARIASLDHRPQFVRELSKKIDSLPPWDKERASRCGTRCKITEDGERMVRLEFEDQSTGWFPKEAVVGGDGDLMAAIAVELRVTDAHLRKTLMSFIQNGQVNQEEFQQWEQLAAAKLRPFGGEAVKS